MDDSTNDKAVSVLNDLIETCKDGAKGFSTASEDAESSELKQLCARYAAERGAFATELETLVHGLGGKAAESGHVAAVAHRGWINLKAAVSGNDDKAILNECERGEDYAKKAYADALKETLPSNVRTVVERQASSVRAAHDTVRALRDRVNAAAEAGVDTPALQTDPQFRD